MVRIYSLYIVVYTYGEFVQWVPFISVYEWSQLADNGSIITVQWLDGATVVTGHLTSWSTDLQLHTWAVPHRYKQYKSRVEQINWSATYMDTYMYMCVCGIVCVSMMYSVFCVHFQLPQHSWRDLIIIVNDISCVPGALVCCYSQLSVVIRICARTLHVLSTCMLHKYM